MKVQSKKDDYIVECKEIEETTAVINYILNDNEYEFTYWKYVMKNGEDWNIDDKIRPKYHNLPVISFEEWQKLPDYDPKEVAFKSFVLPEKWKVKWNKEVGKYYSVKSNKCYLEEWYFLRNINSSNQKITDIGSNMDASFSGYEDDEFELITFDQFKKHVLGENPKKLIGYKLVKEEYKEAVKQILKCNPTQDSDFLIGLLIHLNSDFHRKLKDAEVLDLWFDPFYEELSIEEKISDYLAGEGIGLTDEQVKNVIDIVNESKAPKM